MLGKPTGQILGIYIFQMRSTCTRPTLFRVAVALYRGATAALDWRSRQSCRRRAAEHGQQGAANLIGGDADHVGDALQGVADDPGVQSGMGESSSCG